MKKTMVFILILLLFVMLGGSVGSAYALENNNALTEKAKSAYLVDYNTGTVLYERNADEKLPIASMVKIMTLVITFENIEKGNLTFDQKITVSDTAAGMGGSQMFLDANKEYTVSDLIKGVVVCSANDAAVALGETISGSKEAFIDDMNKKAKELGMNDTVFVNVTGLPESGQHSTAKDVTKMMHCLLKHKEYYNYSTIYMEDYTHPDGRVTELTNTNKLIRFYKGCDAGKTGFTNDAMFCLSASAKRNDMRVVATVIGAPDSKVRFAEVSSLFNYAFANYKQEKIVDSQQILSEKIEVVKGKEEFLEIRANGDIYALVKKGDKAQYSVNVTLPENVKAPIKAGDIIGEIEVVTQSGETIGKVSIIANKDVNTLNYMDALKKILNKWFLR